MIKDFVRVMGVTSRPEINGETYIILGPDEKKNGRWIVGSHREVFGNAAIAGSIKTGMLQPGADIQRAFAASSKLSLSGDKLTLLLAAEEVAMMMEKSNSIKADMASCSRSRQ